MAKAEVRLKLTGPTIEVTNNTPLALTDEESAYVVEGGELIAFAVEMTGDEPGARRFLCAVGPGEAFFGTSPAGSLAVYGTGNAGTEVRQVPMKTLRRKGASGAAEEATRMAEGWIAKMNEGVARYTRDDQPDEVRTLPEPPALDSGITDQLAAFGGASLTSLRALLDDLESTETQRLRVSVLRNEQVEKDALHQMASVLATAKTVPLPVSDDPLLAACQSVGKSLGMAVVAPPRGGEYRGSDPLRRIAKASRLRMRNVSLNEDWWRTEGGPLLGRLEDGTPVALVPKRGARYEVIDHSRGERTDVTAAVAATVAPNAIVFYRSWDPEPVGPREIFKMGLHGATSDLGRIAMYGVASAILALITPIATAELFNSIIPSAARGRLGILVIALILGAIAAAMFNLAQSLALVRLQTRLDGSLSAATWDRLLRLPVSFFRQFSVGDLAQRALAINQIRQILAQAGFTGILSAIFSLSSLVLLFVYDPSLALIALVLVAVSTGVTLFLIYRQIKKQRVLQAVKGELSGLVIQQITGVSKLRVTAAEGRAFAEWSKLYSAQQKLAVEVGTLKNLQTTFTAAWPPVTTLVIFYMLSNRGIGKIDPGSFLAFFAAFGQVLMSSRMITGTVGSVLQSIPLYERAKPIFQAIPEVHADAADPGKLSGGLEISHVTFRYDADGPIILNDVSLSVQPREMVAVVGPSGAGKSSLIRLILGFENPELGSVIFDGQDLDTLDVELVRRQIGVVLQTAQLMPGTIYTNIVGEAGLSRDDAWAAAISAGLESDLEQMPMGLDTLVQAGGAAFSGGQKQRLLIARALATQPSLLLFDEATSALDNLTQKVVTESLAQLPVTRIVIAHRLSTIMGADRIIVMVKGHVAEQGTYDELMANRGPFYELAARQLA